MLQDVSDSGVYSCTALSAQLRQEFVSSIPQAGKLLHKCHW